MKIEISFKLIDNLKKILRFSDPLSHKVPKSRSFPLLFLSPFVCRILITYSAFLVHCGMPAGIETEVGRERDGSSCDVHKNMYRYLPWLPCHVQK